MTRECRRNPIEFADLIDVPGRPISGDELSEDGDVTFARAETNLAAHHRLILSEMDACANKRHGRLMIFAPPGSAKSSYASVVYPAHFLGKTKDRRIILASYGDDLATKMGRRTRSIVTQPMYRSIFDAGLTSESSAAHSFSLTNGSEYMATGLLSGITGNRAHGIILDDPVKGRESANSQALSEKSWAAYNEDLKTRLIPGGWIVIIMTRWSQDDIAGRILPDSWNGESGDIACKDGNVWRVLCLQAKCDNDTDPLKREIGQYIWPEWFDAGHWAQFESLPISWAALYQQIPTPGDGLLFKPDMMPILPALPVTGSWQWVRKWDLAASIPKQGTDPDWTVGALIGKDNQDRFIIADVVRFRGSPDEVNLAISNTANRDGHGVKIHLSQDPAQAGKAQVAFLTRMLAGYKVASSLDSGSKVTGAEPFAAQVNVGNVSLLQSEWNRAFIDELRAFPMGRKDDQVDAAAGGFNELITGAKKWSFGTL